MQDRYLKIMLTLVAVLLAANLVQSLFTNPGSPAELFMGNANAQDVNEKTPTSRLDQYNLVTLNGFPVENLSGVDTLGDGKTFIVSNSQGFMVYQVLPKR